MSTSAMVTLQTGNKYIIGSTLQNLQHITFSFDNLKNVIAVAKIHAVAPSLHLVMTGIYSPGVIHGQNNMVT